MAGETIVTVVGNLTADPELRFTSSGAAVASFRVASTPRTFNRQSGTWEDGDTLFVSCSAWRQLGENVAESLTKGTRVIVTGRLRMRSYEARDGGQRQSLEIDVDEVGPSLRSATAKVTRVSRAGGAGGAGGSGGGQGGFAGNAASGGGGGNFTQSSGPVPDDPWAVGPSGAPDEPPF